MHTYRSYWIGICMRVYTHHVDWHILCLSLCLILRLQLRLCPLGQTSRNPSAFAGRASASGPGNRSSHSISGIPACLRPQDPFRKKLAWGYWSTWSYMILHCAYIVLSFGNVHKIAQGNTFSQFQEHSWDLAEYNAHNAKVAQHTLTTNHH